MCTRTSRCSSSLVHTRCGRTRCYQSACLQPRTTVRPLMSALPGTSHSALTTHVMTGTCMVLFVVRMHALQCYAAVMLGKHPRASSLQIPLALAGVLTPSSEHAFAQVHHSALILALQLPFTTLRTCVWNKGRHPRLKPHFLLGGATLACVSHVLCQARQLCTLVALHTSAPQGALRVTTSSASTSGSAARGSRGAAPADGTLRGRRHARTSPRASRRAAAAARRSDRTACQPRLARHGLPSHAQLDAEHGRRAALGIVRARAPGRGHIQRERQRRRRAQEAGHRLRARGQHARAQPRVRAQLQPRQRPAARRARCRSGPCSVRLHCQAHGLSRSNTSAGLRRALQDSMAFGARRHCAIP